MQNIHVRNIFQLFIPIGGDGKNGFAMTLSDSPSYGIGLLQKDTNESYHYQIKLMVSDDSEERLYEDCLSWAKRNPYHLQTQHNTRLIEGLVIRVKVNTGVFDFRRGKQKLVRLVVDCFRQGSFLCRGGSSLCQLHPKRRFVDDTETSDDEVMIPVSWTQNFSTNSSMISPQRSSENTSPIAYSPEEDSVMHTYSSSDHERSCDTSANTSVNNYLITPVTYANEENYGSYGSDHQAEIYKDPEQYMVLFNGNAEVLGNFRALNFYKASDINLKEDIRLLVEDHDCRGMLMKIDGVEYKFKDHVAHATNKRFIGYIAQQIEQVVPEAVQLIDGILHVDYEALIPYLSESIKQNYNDLNQIRGVVDQIYNEFIQKNNQPKNSSVNSKTEKEFLKVNTPRPKKRNNPALLRKWIVGLSISLGLFLIFASVSAFLIWVVHPLDPPVKLTPLLPAEKAEHNTTTDRHALEELFAATDGPNWRYNDSWMTRESICSWFGVKCNEKNRVTDLSLEGNNLQGTLPESIGALTKLKYISLHKNLNLSGTIPKHLFQLPNLEVILLTKCNLTGTLPPIPSNSNIIAISVGHNKLYGTIPKYEGLISLQMLEISDNYFSGSFPIMPIELDNLMISRNRFEGEFEMSAEMQRSLTHLEIAHNEFSGVRPFVIDDTTLLACDAAENKFKCPIPEWTIRKCNATCI